MFKTAFILALLPLALAAAPALAAQAPIDGNWHITGQISGKDFALDCQFKTEGTGFGGVCTDAAHGKPHVLSSGTISGNQVAWAYPAHYMMMKFDVKYSGTINGASMQGSATAAGRNGSFAGQRK